MKSQKPILFSTPMVQAILDGTKTMTRRICKNQNVGNINPVFGDYPMKAWPMIAGGKADACPYGQPGTILWVRECFIHWMHGEYWYKANYQPNMASAIKWKPSIHMPKAASRIWLEIKDIKVERLQDITEDDALAEGVFAYDDGTFKNYFTQKGLRPQDGVECLLAKGSFQSLWCSINGTESWNQNPWVWAVTFKILSTTGKPANIQ